MVIEFPELPFSSEALAPVISARTLEFHHGKHHRTYVDNANKLIAGTELAAETQEAILLKTAGDTAKVAIFNNVAQAWNHAFFWVSMTPHPAAPVGALLEAIQRSFGDLASLRKTFLAEGAAHFGSGWIWLAADGSRICVVATHDAETLVTRQLTPLLVCDVWEHAYYLDHQNDRARFLEAWWDRLANWNFAAAQFAAAGGEAQGWRHPLAETPQPAAVDGHAEVERALQEALALVASSPAPGSAEDQRLAELLGAIARHRIDLPSDGTAAALAADLDRRLKGAERWAAERAAGGQEPWSPMVGGDLHQHPPAAPHDS